MARLLNWMARNRSRLVAVMFWVVAIAAWNIWSSAQRLTPLAAVQAWSGVARGTTLFESMVVFDYLTLDSCLQLPGRHFEYIGQTNYPLALLVYGDENKADAAATAENFLRERKDVWTTWVPDDVAAKVEASLG